MKNTCFQRSARVLQYVLVSGKNLSGDWYQNDQVMGNATGFNNWTYKAQSICWVHGKVSCAPQSQLQPTISHI